MHFSKRASRKALFSACLILPFFMYACGGDSNNNATAIESSEEEDEDNLGGSNFTDTSITGTQFYSNAGVVNIIKSEILDVNSGNSYKTIQFGPYTWMAENANYKISRSACYNEDTDNCKKFGRLYQHTSASQACPSGFNVPSEADFKYMAIFTNNIIDPAFGFNPQLSGYCETVNGELQCSRGDKEAYYQTSDFNIFRINGKGKYDFPEANYSAYYALRCVKVTHFVENEKQLPICDSTTYSSLGNFYIASKGYNYRCNRKKWVEADDNNCPSSERGEKHYYKDTLFVCRGSWQYATMNDVDASCTKKNQWEVRKLNGQNYICDDSTWRKPSTIETALGLCNLDSLKKTKAYIDDDDTTGYICDSTGWRKTVLIDSIGTCTAKNQWALKINYGKKYICDDSTWRKPSTIEDSIGLCTPDSLKKMKTLKTKSDSTHYFCDTTGWRKAVLIDSIGQCTKDRQWEQKKNYSKNYLCRDSSWRKATAREDSIGFCIPSKNGKIDSLKSSSSYESYYCDSTSWRSTVLADFHGTCDSTKFYSTVEYKGSTYACRTTKSWTTLSSTEKNLGVCTPKIYGKIDSLKSSGTSYICDSTGWRSIVLEDVAGKCDSTKFYNTVEYKGSSYACRTTNKWTTLSSTEKSIGICMPKIYDKIDTIKSSGTSYICDTTGWRTATVYDYYGSCDSTKLYTSKTVSGITYGCQNAKSWEKLTHPTTVFGFCTPKLKGTLKADSTNKVYICDSLWRTATKDEVLGVCNEDNEGLEKTYSSIKYACINKEWRTYTSLEKSIGLCYKGTLGKIASDNNVTYICKEDGWKKYAIEDAYGKCTNSIKGKIVEFGNETYGCAGYYWRKLDSLDLTFGMCLERDEHKIYEYNGNHYFCDDDEWEIAPYWNVLEKCTKAIEGKIVKYREKQYYCSQPEGWQEYDALDKELGKCDSKSYGISKVYNGYNYGCVTENGNDSKRHKWRKENDLDKALGFCYGNTYDWTVYEGKDYVCDDDGEWYTASSLWAMYSICDDRFPARLGKTVGFKGQHYYCNVDMEPSNSKTDGWYALQPIDSIKGPCYFNKLGDTLTFEGEYYYCGKNTSKVYRWIPATKMAEYYGKCTSSNDGVTVSFEGSHYQCNDGLWHRDPIDYSTITDSRDGNQYKTIKIGSQEWMAENLKYEVEGSWCGGNINGCVKYGRLYSWDMTMGLPKNYNPTLVDIENPENHQGICPDGWRVPSSIDWATLLKECSVAELRTTLTGYDSEHTDFCGFTAIPTGYENVKQTNNTDYTEELSSIGSEIAFWSSEQNDKNFATAASLSVKTNITNPLYSRLKRNGYSVRCIKNTSSN